MNELGIMLTTSVAFAFLFAGFSKALWIKDSSRFASNLGVFPPKLGAILGLFMPLMELVAGVGMLINNSPLIMILGVAIIMFFVILNLKAIMDKKSLSCFCYGNIIKTKLGQGGFIHYIYLLFTVLIGFFTTKSTLINVISEYEMINLILICSISFLIFINGVIIRLVLDKLS